MDLNAQSSKMTRVWLCNNRNMVHGKKAKERPRIMDSATHALGHFILGDFEQKRMLRGSIVAACRRRAARGTSTPEEKRVLVMMVPVKHIKTV